MERSTFQVESLEEDDDFLLEIAAIEAQVEAAKRPRLSIPEGPYMAALKGSKSEQWQKSPLNPASKSRSVSVTTGGFQRSDGGDVAGEHDLPEKNCPCGVLCLVLTSNTPKNPGRKFYKCPNRESLNNKKPQKMVETCDQRIKRMRVETHPLKLSRAETWNVVDVQDVFIDILSRLSVKSVLSCKTLSKHWYDSMSTTHFYKLQLEHSRKNPSFIVSPTMESPMKLYSMDSRSFELSPINTIDPSERSHEVSMYMVSSFNGLICCVNMICDEDVESKFYDLQIWICNPCTRETLLLPQGRPSFEFEPSVGVAYGSDISDYRIFRIFCAGKKIPEERVPMEEFDFREGQLFRKYRYVLAYECEVYSSSTGSWKNIGPVPCVPMRYGLRPYKTDHIFVGGKIYWLASLTEPGEILSVDLEGRFEVINLPEYPDGNEEDRITEGTHLVVLQESLGLVVLHPECMDILVWKNDGEKYSWVDELTVPILIEYDEVVLAVTSLKNKIICVTETHWHIYDVDTKRWKKERGPLTGFAYPAVFPFTESILPCNGGVSNGGASL